MKLTEALWQDNQRMSGAVCFRGTRVPVEFVFDHLESGSIEEFYQDFPDVTPEQVHAVVSASKEFVEASLKAAA